MNLRDLRYITALNETGHFGRAAEKCHVTQPTLSMQIAKMESELNILLFERNKRNVVATPVGRRIIKLASQVEDTVNEIHETARNATEVLSGPFYLGVIPTVGPYLLPHILPQLKSTFPDLELYLREDKTSKLVASLLSGKLDAAILSPPLPDLTIQYELLYSEEYLAAMPNNHPLTKRKRLAPSDIENETLLFLEEGNCMRAQTLSLCSATRSETFHATSIESLRQMVSAGNGCTFLPKLSTEGAYANMLDVAVRPFKNPAPTREIVLAWRPTYPKPETLHRLAKTLVPKLNV